MSDRYFFDKYRKVYMVTNAWDPTDLTEIQNRINNMIARVSVGANSPIPNDFEDWMKNYLQPQSPNPPKPQYRGAIRAWRFWILSSNTLRSLVADYMWAPGASRAMARDSFGFYGFTSLTTLRENEQSSWQLVYNSVSAKRYRNYVVGSFLAYGKINLHEYGLRAEWAKPEYLLFSGDSDFDTTLLAVADRYGMKAISLGEAETLKDGLVPYYE